MKKKIYVDIHVLQTVPPSCVNRDDTGSPKTAVYGGTTRARVSSQAWKRAMRMYFVEIFAQQQLGLRTKRIVGMVADELKSLCPQLSDGEAEKKAMLALENAGLKIKDAAKGTDAMFLMSRSQAKKLAEYAAAGETNKKAYKEALLAEPSVEMALFGRMVASDPSLNYDAAAQVAHSISTHTVHNEYDYFTAVDDCSPEDNAGAGHLGTVEFNSSTLYRYATVNVRELAGSLGEETPGIVRGFAEAFIKSMPTGKQNTFANRTIPDDVYICVRSDQPVNFSGAFEKPVPSQSGGYVDGSEKRLTAYAKRTYDSFLTAPEKTWGVGEAMAPLAKLMPLDELLDELEGWLKKRLSDREVE